MEIGGDAVHGDFDFLLCNVIELLNVGGFRLKIVCSESPFF